MGLVPSDFRSDHIFTQLGDNSLITGYRRPWTIVGHAPRDLAEKKKDFYFGKYGFQACVDVNYFKPTEITVKIVDQTVAVEGKHEERDDGYGVIERHFVRKYTLPEDYDMDTLTSVLSSDGVLTLKAPLPTDKVRYVTIAETNIPIQLIIKENKPIYHENGDKK